MDRAHCCVRLLVGIALCCSRAVAFAPLAHHRPTRQRAVHTQYIHPYAEVVRAQSPVAVVPLPAALDGLGVALKASWRGLALVLLGRVVTSPRVTLPVSGALSRALRAAANLTTPLRPLATRAEQWHSHVSKVVEQKRLAKLDRTRQALAKLESQVNSSRAVVAQLNSSQAVVASQAPSALVPDNSTTLASERAATVIIEEVAARWQGLAEEETETQEGSIEETAQEDVMIEDAAVAAPAPPSRETEASETSTVEEMGKAAAPSTPESPASEASPVSETSTVEQIEQVVASTPQESPASEASPIAEIAKTSAPAQRESSAPEPLDTWQIQRAFTGSPKDAAVALHRVADTLGVDAEESIEAADKIMKDTDGRKLLMEIQQNPQMMQIVMDVVTKGETTAEKYANDPEVVEFLSRFQKCQEAGGSA